jgi:hypothetical protein
VYDVSKLMKIVKKYRLSGNWSNQWSSRKRISASSCLCERRAWQSSASTGTS